ncbi:MAG TPA: zinc-binding dehydrogenase, partial [Mycobacterium sp.]|nr:zinc-binding dehydrogenase [Mycobacterium sp.]
REVTSLQRGDRVVVPFAIACGACRPCQRSLWSLCDNSNPNAWMAEKLYGYSGSGLFGYSHMYGGYAGGQAEFVRVPFADVGPAIIPEWMADEDALMCTDALATGYFGAQLGDIVEGDVVTVFGAGPVGLYAAKSAWLMGAGRVIVIDHLDYRLEKARTFAHAETYNFAEHDDIVVEMKKATGYLGADVAIDAVGAEADGNLMQHIAAAKLKIQGGSPIALNWAIDSVRKGGTVSVMGAYGPIFSAVKFGDAMNKGLTLRMNQCPVKRQWSRLFSHIQNGYIKPGDIVTHRIPLEHIAEGYHIFSAKLDNCIKPIIVPGAA